MQSELYTDGGVIGKNPSKLGGVWGWVLVEADQIIRFGSGIITPADIGEKSITNNLTELLGAVRGLEAMGENWNGVWHTDSQITMFRLIRPSSKHSVPKWLEGRIKALAIHRKWTHQMVGGHATKAELAAGIRKRNGFKTSKWNSWVDKLCNQTKENLSCR